MIEGGGEAINYTLSCWPWPSRFPDDCPVCLRDNAAEGTLRVFPWAASPAHFAEQIATASERRPCQALS